MSDGKSSTADSLKYQHERELRQQRLTRSVLLILLAVVLCCAARMLFAGGVPAWRMISAALSAVLFACSFTSLVCDAWTIGMLIPAGAGTAFFVLFSLWDILTAPKPLWINIALCVVGAAVAAVIIYALVVSALMLYTSIAYRYRGGEGTVIVLGCSIKGNQPGRMLKRRLDAAIKLMKKHPSLPCVITGGATGGKKLSEAEVMRRYMLEKGVSPERVYAEDKASTTYENFRFSLNIMNTQELARKAIIVTDRFHQRRARQIAADVGLQSSCKSCETAWYLVLQYWSREILCIAEKRIKKL